MVSLKQSPPNPTFSTKSPVPTPAMRNREKLRMLVLIGVTVIFIALLVDVLMSEPQPKPASEVAATVVQMERDQAETMDLVAIDALPTWPAAEAVSAQAEQGQYLTEHPKEVSLYAKPFDALTMAWLQRQLPLDQQEPPLPLAYTGDDVVLGRVRHGRAMMIGGTITDIVTTSHPEFGEWVQAQILLPQVDERTLVALLEAPRSAFTDDLWETITPGFKVHSVGRYLGTAELATVTDQQQEVPVVAAYSIRQQNQASLLDLLQLGRSEERGRVWRADPMIYDRVDDYYDDNPGMSHLERRPYYYTLGQVRLDLSTPGVYADAQPIEQYSHDVWEQPAAFRGQPFVVKGRVVEAWVDEQATLDKPFGVERVVRLWMWDTVFGIGAAPFRNLFEVAVLMPDANQPLPEEGDYVQLTGRFLKVLTYYSAKSHYMSMVDPERVDNEYTLFKFFVAPELTIVPPEPLPDHFWFKIGSLVVMASFLGFMVVMMILEGRRSDHYKQGMHRLRENRRRLAKASRAQKTDPEASPSSGANADTNADGQPANTVDSDAADAAS